jgi:hypothetical protein
LAHSTGISDGKENPRDACTACGNLLLPGWTTKTEVATIQVKHRPGERQRQRPQDERERDRHREAKVRQLVVSRRCSFCHRVTRETADKHLRAKLNKERQSNSTAAAPISGEKITRNQETATADERTTTETAAVAKLSSKKRARARKDREGLQALLNKSAQNKAGPSLGLMDLMKR